MKKFFEGGEFFVLSSFFIEAVPIGEDCNVGIMLARTICEDACYLSSEGTGQVSVEILRIASNKTGGYIQHIFTIRTHDRSEQDCVIRQEAIVKGMNSLLHGAGFEFREESYEDYKKHLSEVDSRFAWALMKQDVHEFGMQGAYKSPSVVKNIDWERIYAALNGSGCTLCIQIIPTMLSDNERRLIANRTTQYTQAVDGVVANIRDSLALAAAERWKYYSQEVSHPFAEVNIIISGTIVDSALVTARMKQAVRENNFSTSAISDLDKYSVYNQPWKVTHNLRKAANQNFAKWTSEEISQIFQFPVQGKYFIGVEKNPFSLMPEICLLPKQMTCNGAQSIKLGKSVFSSQEVSLSLKQILLHTAVLGKSGVGKTTLLKQLIGQFQSYRIPVLVMEPVKCEYRDLIAEMKDSKIFTVERPVVPLLINPFYVPSKVPLGVYKSSLLSAFKAAFSLPDPLPALFEKAISESYTLHGWTDTSTSSDDNVTVFDMAEFIVVFKRAIARSSYSNEVKGNMMSGGAFRLQSLIERCPYTFGTIRSTSVEDILNGCVVLEMGSLEPEQKSLVSALTLISVLAYLKSTRKSNHELRNIILIDEAHALLDMGEGATQEEKSLNSTMTQLMINIITEIRAYGVGIIISDQSPSRVGARILDNVDNIISFRLSGKEGELLKEHMAEESTLSDILPLMSVGEFVVKNQFLRSALPVKMEYIPNREQVKHISDEYIIKSQSAYLAIHAKDYCPFALCNIIGCRCCSNAVRSKANMYAEQIFIKREYKLHTPEEIAAHIVSIPAVLSDRINSENEMEAKMIYQCVAIHLLRKCSIEKGISFSRESINKLLNDIAI